MLRRPRLHAFDEPAATRRRGRLVLRLLVTLLALHAVFATPALAQGGCSEAPTPEYPGAGSVVGQIDPPSLAHGGFGSAYEDVSYAGLTWNTYGYSGACYLADPQAGTDTYLGSILFNVGKTITAITASLWYVVQDGGMLAQFDDFINVATPAFYDAVFTPYIALALLIVAMIILWRTLQGDMAEIGKRTFWIFAGLWLASTTYLTPLVYTQLTDQILVHGASELQGNLLKNAGYDDMRNGLPTMLHDQTVVQPWQLGEFGGTNTPQAQQYSRPLWEAQACTKTEVLEHSCNTDAKKAGYTQIATQLKDTPAYPYFSGSAHSRIGAGAMSAMRAFCYDLFQLCCGAGVVLAQIVVRVVVVGGPVLGLLAIMKTSVMPTVFRSIGNAVSQGLILTVAAAGHAFALGWVLRPQSGMSPFSQLLVMSLVTIALWLAVRPVERLAQMTASAVGVTMPTWAQRRQAQAMRSRRGGGPARRGLGMLGRWLVADASRSWRNSRESPEPDTVGSDDGPRQRPEGAGSQVPTSDGQGSSTSGRRSAPADPPNRSEAAGEAATAGPRAGTQNAPRADTSTSRPQSGPESRSETADPPTRRTRPASGEQQPNAGGASGTDRGPGPRSQEPPERESAGGTGRGGQQPRSQDQSEPPRRRPRRVRPREDGVHPGAVEGRRPENTEPHEDAPLWSEQED